MSLVDELLSRLKIEDVIGAQYGLRRTGSELRTEAHHSLVIDPERQLFTWFSREVDGRPAGGSVLSFLALEAFHTTKFKHLNPEQKRAVMDQACKLAGIDRAAWKRANPAQHGSKPHAAGTHAPARRKKGKTYATALEAVEACDRWLERDGFTQTASWIYEALTKRKHWEPAIKVLRYDHMDGAKQKQIRPIHRVKNGWRIGLGPWGAKRWNPETKQTERARLCPLYRLPKIEKALAAAAEGQALPDLHVVEGEKCADALARFGFLATTSQGGCGRWAETDWSPLKRWVGAGGRVLCWPDQDAAGRAYVDDVAESIQTT